MHVFFITNSLTKKREQFVPFKAGYVGMYTCGPTIYSFPTIGNWRTYTLSDVLYRTLKYLGNDVNYVMNLTDVGHLSGDNLGDASQGIDRMSKAAEAEGVDAWVIATKYETDFLATFKILNLVMPNTVCRATDHINEQIELIKRIEAKGYTYTIDDGVYFDVAKYEKDGNKYGELSNIDELNIEGTRINPNEQKKDPRDFALWKFFATGQKRHKMEWQSPWGIGFPGWHIECSAMSMKYLGDQFDFHLGGEDLKSTHHPNEIAQAESATGHKPFVKYWVHGAFLQVNGGRMGKSLGNAYTIHDVLHQGSDPMALRYFYLSGKYNAKLNFTWEALQSAQNSLHKLIEKVAQLQRGAGLTESSIENASKSVNTTNDCSAGSTGSADNAENEHVQNDQGLGQHTEFIAGEFSDPAANLFVTNFRHAICDDLNMPVALAVIWDLFKTTEVEVSSKLALISDFDKVLGLELMASASAYNAKLNKADLLQNDYSPEIKALIKKRQDARLSKDWATADQIRKQLIDLGVRVSDDVPTSKKKD